MSNEVLCFFRVFPWVPLSQYSLLSLKRLLSLPIHAVSRLALLIGELNSPNIAQTLSQKYSKLGLNSFSLAENRK